MQLLCIWKYNRLLLVTNIFYANCDDGGDEDDNNILTHNEQCYNELWAGGG